MLKKTFFAVAVLSALSINASRAADGTINFTGSIVASTCDVAEAGGAGLNVPLGVHSADTFSQAGDSAGDTRFSFTLSSCDASITGARVVFDGPRDSTNNDLLEVSDAGGVGIGIFEGNGTTPVPLGQPSQAQSVAGNATLNFTAKYVATNTTVTEGDADATADFTIQYQ